MRFEELSCNRTIDSVTDDPIKAQTLAAFLKLLHAVDVNGRPAPLPMVRVCSVDATLPFSAMEGGSGTFDDPIVSSN